MMFLFGIYLFRFIFPKKKVYITFHGWEGKWPLPMWAILNKRIANFLCNGSIAVGIYIEKWYGIKLHTPHTVV